jgi:hypothetical protein
MKPIFNIALIFQSLCAAVFIIHRFVKPFGSDLMFGVLIVSALLGGYLLWQSFRNKAILGASKMLGITLGFLPILWLLMLVLFVGTTKM